MAEHQQPPPEAEPGESAGGPRLHGDLLTTSLLAMLRGWNAYGYQLAQQLRARGLPVFDQGTVYRTLRQLERGGLVNSFWDTGDSGPARRMYRLTATGEAFLASWLDALERYQRFLGSLWGIPQPGGASAAHVPATPAPEPAAAPDPPPTPPDPNPHRGRRSPHARAGTHDTD